MIPVIGTVFAVAVRASTVMTLAGTAGMGYGLGRKYGRIACEWMDQIEFRVSERINEHNAELQ